ncbi:hypothetical protein B296_00001492 [Ensete ventricosum]|uniref:Uncharacterized protein n=1 Tax=Ensete ventricosum TaxID=4639 RepID=A0A426Z7V8_ENSVE|nr:hypothetical protein B296_00001492 [Ensete ventricosum]
MHPLRFPNYGIRAKVARRRGDQPRQAPMQGWPATARSRPRLARKERLPAGATARRGDAYGHGGLQSPEARHPQRGRL